MGTQVIKRSPKLYYAMKRKIQKFLEPQYLFVRYKTPRHSKNTTRNEKVACSSHVTSSKTGIHRKMDAGFIDSCLKKHAGKLRRVFV